MEIKLITKYFDNWLIVSVIFQAHMWKFLWFQLLKCDHLMLFFIIYENKLNTLGFWTVGRIKEHIWRIDANLGLGFGKLWWLLLAFYKQNDLIYKLKKWKYDSDWNENRFKLWEKWIFLHVLLKKEMLRYHFSWTDTWTCSIGRYRVPLRYQRDKKI